MSVLVKEEEGADLRRARVRVSADWESGGRKGNESLMVSYLQEEVRMMRQQNREKLQEELRVTKAKQAEEKAMNDDRFRLLLERENKEREREEVAAKLMREQWRYQQEMHTARDKLMQELMMNVHNNNLHQQVAGSAFAANMIGNVAGCLNLNFKPQHATRSLPLLPTSASSPVSPVPFPSEFHYGGGPNASDSGGANPDHGGGGDQVSGWDAFTRERNRKFEIVGDKIRGQNSRRTKRKETGGCKEERNSKVAKSGSKDDTSSSS